MAIYHFHVKVIGRRSGSSAVASAAYRSASRLRDDRLERSHDFSVKRGVVHSEVLLPEHAPEAWTDRERLWNDVEAFEVRKDAQLAREVEFALPREMTRADMDKVIADYVAAAKRAIRAGFDMLEVHAAHGYLLASFISPLTNIRRDEYGGALENRMRFPLEVFRAVRAVWPDEKPMSVRISATDWEDGGLTGEDAVTVARLFAESGCDLIDVSTGQTTPDAQPIYGRMFQTPYADQIRNEAGLATMCVGAITTADQVNTIVAAGRADLVALARPHLTDPSFAMKAAAWYGAADIHCPPQYYAGRDQIFRNSERDRAELTELRLKAKPKSHVTTFKQAAE